MFKIWVTADDRELKRAVCAFLRRSGYEAVRCLCAEEAYDALYETVFGLIISDSMMPGTDGFEFARTVREQNAERPPCLRRSGMLLRLNSAVFPPEPAITR